MMVHNMGEPTIEFLNLITDRIGTFKLREWTCNYLQIIVEYHSRDSEVKWVGYLKLTHPNSQHLEIVVNMDLQNS